MNRRQKKKLENKKALWTTCITSIHSQWNTNTPDWKRCKKSGRKRMIREHMYMPSYTRNFRRYSPILIAEAIKRLNFDNSSSAIEIANDNITRN